MAESVNRKKGAPDYALLLVIICLVCLGIFMVFDASYAKAGQMRYTGQDVFYFVKRQCVWAAIGTVALLLAGRLSYWRLRRLALAAPVLAIVLLLLVLVPGVGISMNGARRWIGYSWLSMQPSEFAKLALVLFLAHLGAAQRRRVRDLWFGFMPRVVMLALIGALIAEEDLGTAIVVMATGLVMLAASGARATHIAGFAASLVAATGLAILREPYRADRLKAWLAPWDHYYRDGWQVTHSLLAIGSGGWLGAGIGKGLQKFHYLPAEKTDFIFSTIGEEMGFVGGLLVLLLFMLFVYRGFCIAHRMKDPFGALLAVGITSMVGFQALLNIAVTANAVPPTGVPLPFISFGGSSLVVTMFAAGVLLNVSMYPDAVGQERDESHRIRRRDRRSHLPRPKHRRSTPASRRGGAVRWQPRGDGA